MDFHTYITMRDWTRRADPEDRLAQDIDQFDQRAQADAVKMGSSQFFNQMLTEQGWRRADAHTTTSGPPSCRCSPGWTLTWIPT